MPSTKPATNAPRTLPRPPKMVTMSAWIIGLNPELGFKKKKGESSTPASPASAPLMAMTMP